MRIGGITHVSIDGTTITVKGTANLSSVTTERESVTGAGGVVGYIENYIPAFLELEVITDEAGALEFLAAPNGNSTVTCETGDGRVYTFPKCWRVGRPEKNGIDGSISVRYESRDADEFGGPS